MNNKTLVSNFINIDSYNKIYGSLSCKNNILYSYNVPIAIKSNSIILVNNHKYSVTTNKHIGYITGNNIYYVDFVQLSNLYNIYSMVNTHNREKYFTNNLNLNSISVVDIMEEYYDNILFTQYLNMDHFYNIESVFYDTNKVKMYRYNYAKQYILVIGDKYFLVANENSNNNIINYTNLIENISYKSPLNIIYELMREISINYKNFHRLGNVLFIEVDDIKSITDSYKSDKIYYNISVNCEMTNNDYELNNYYSYEGLMYCSKVKFNGKIFKASKNKIFKIEQFIN